MDGQIKQIYEVILKHKIELISENSQDRSLIWIFDKNQGMIFVFPLRKYYGYNIF